MATTEDDLWKTAFSRLVPWTIKRHGMSCPDAEETVQEAVRLFLKAGKTVDPANAKALLDALGSQINGIAVNRRRNKAMQAVQLTADGSLTAADPAPGQEQQVIDDQLAKRAVSLLLDRVRSDDIATAIVIEMSGGNDVPAEQARAIGCSVADVYKGRQRLKAHVKAVCEKMEAP